MFEEVAKKLREVGSVDLADIFERYGLRGAEPRCPLGVPWPLQKKKKKSTSLYKKFNCTPPPQMMYIYPPPISVQFTPSPSML